MSEPQINPEYLKLTERDLQEWLWAYSQVTSVLERVPNWQTAAQHAVFNGMEKPLEGVRLAKQLNEELDKLRDLNADKFSTINAYCRMASWDKWKIQRLMDAIDHYISAAGYTEHTRLLTEARAEVVNSKTGFWP